MKLIELRDLVNSILEYDKDAEIELTIGRYDDAYPIVKCNVDGENIKNIMLNHSLDYSHLGELKVNI